MKKLILFFLVFGGCTFLTFGQNTASISVSDLGGGIAAGTVSFDITLDAISDGSEMGTFQMKTRKARKGKNPQTGATISIPSKKVVTFRGGKSLSKSL